MDKLSSWNDIAFGSLNEIGKQILNAIPSILGAILVLIIGYFLTRLIVMGLKKLLTVMKVNNLTSLLNEKEVFGTKGLNINFTAVILGFVKWVLFLIILIIASDILNWNIISSEIGNLLHYLPRLFSAIALFMIGLYVANFVKKAINGLFDSFELIGARLISSLVFYLIVIIITITSLNQAGIATDIITNNITVILGAFLGAIAIGFGLGSKEVVADLLRTFYVRKNYEIGQKINFNGTIGSIEAIDNIALTLKTETGRIIIPIKEIVENQVEVFDE